MAEIIRNNWTKELIEAYFKGGNVRDKQYQELERQLRVIQKVVEGKEEKEET